MNIFDKFQTRVNQETETIPLNIPENIPFAPAIEDHSKGNAGRHAILFPLLFVLFLWLVEGLETYFKFRPVELGIVPRTFDGLLGIFTAPFIHAGTDHLLSNSLPLIVVGTGLLYFYRSIARRVIVMIWLFTGFWVWLGARPEPHIGASGLIYGFVVFLFFSGLLRRDTRLMAISMLVTFLYGSMVWGILPIDQTISWESHFFGSVAGLFTAIYYRKEGPQRPKSQWEIDEEIGKTDEPEYGPFENTNLSPQTGNPPLKITYEYIEKEQNAGAEKDSSPS